MDANSAALKSYMRDQDKSDRDRKDFRSQVVEELVDDIMFLRQEKDMKGFTLASILVNEDFTGQIARLIQPGIDDRLAIVEEIRARCMEIVDQWVDTSCEADMIIQERVNERAREE